MKSEKIFQKNIKSDNYRFLFVFILILALFYFSFPKQLFNDSTSTVIEDRKGQLLGARLGADEQWRFPISKEIPAKFAVSIVEFEDKRFFNHIGIDPISFFRASYLNIKKRKIVSGGSTISMQVIRLSRNGKPRNIFEKIIEIILATRLELTYSKAEILALYSSNAPFGGNVVGLEAASWRYYNKPPSKLTWSESAVLAVLPNSPSLVFPGKNHKLLKDKRDKLLNKLYKKGYIKDEELHLAILEPLPGKPHKLPMDAKHLLDRCIYEGYKGQRIRTTIDYYVQEKVNSLVLKHYKRFSANKISNAAAIVVEVETGNVIAYVGNIDSYDTLSAATDVDLINAKRSTGSILKPFLYAAMLSDGLLLPNTIVPDIPMHIGSFNPENSTKDFDGAVPASKALSRSLNVPAVWMLQSYGVSRFKFMLELMGISTFTKPTSHYGLSIILGGGEGTLWEITSAYASMARVLNHYTKNDAQYFKNDFRPNNYICNKNTYNDKNNASYQKNLLSASSIWFTFDAMLDVSRPYEDLQWRQFSSGAKIAWKTGTSYGNRDAWAIGCNPEYVVGVWVGNADGEGRPGMTGLSYAAPLFFDIFKILRPKGWFYMPYDDMVKIAVCKHSGYPASNICSPVDTVWVPAKSNMISTCPYHQLIHLDATHQYRVNENCEKIANMQAVPWFVLPPVIETYYKSKNPFYKPLPPYRADCINDKTITIANMDLIYPKNKSRIYIPRELDGSAGKVVCKATHRNPSAIIYWQLNGKFVGSTSNYHHKAFSLEGGSHTITIIDNNGEMISKYFEVIEK